MNPSVSTRAHREHMLIDCISGNQPCKWKGRMSLSDLLLRPLLLSLYLSSQSRRQRGRSSPTCLSLFLLSALHMESPPSKHHCSPVCEVSCPSFNISLNHCLQEVLPDFLSGLTAFSIVFIPSMELPTRHIFLQHNIFMHIQKRPNHS